MSGLYIHIPFCKQACHYCDFHFSTSMGKKTTMLTAIQKEIELRKHEFKDVEVATIYFGGGTPSVLTSQEINAIITSVFSHYNVVSNPEISLEANPDDLSKNKITELAKSPVNRLSIGIQSFFEEDLKLMNRAHSANEAIKSIELAISYFDNISIDLIYGIPGMSASRWAHNIDKALSYNIPHISSYALTVEPKTALASFIKNGKVAPLNDEVAQEHFTILLDKMKAAGFVSYEVSNFGKPGFFSKNNTAYWQQKKYIGIGPSAHSFDGKHRSWNINNNPKYIKSISKGELPSQKELLSTGDRYNEYIMTGLRTIWGVSLDYVQNEFGEVYFDYLLKQSQKFLKQELLYQNGETLLASKKGRFLVDGIAADLFFLN